MAYITDETVGPAIPGVQPTSQASGLPRTAGPAPKVKVQRAEAGLTLEGRHRPIVIRVKGKKGKKRRYSKGTKDFQVGARRMTRVGDRLTNAIADGFHEYRRRSEKSSRRRKDGVLRDILKNTAWGASKTLRRSNKVPVLLAKTVRGKQVRRNVRRMARMLGGVWGR